MDIIQQTWEVRKIIKVARFNNLEFHEDMSLYQSFYLEDYELLKIQDFREEVICIDADNDSYVPKSMLKILQVN